MANIDDLLSLLGDDFDLGKDSGGSSDEGSRRGAGKDSDEDDKIFAGTPTERAVMQMTDSKSRFSRTGEHTFLSNGVFNGCGFASATIEVDDATALGHVDINTHLRFAPSSTAEVSRMLAFMDEQLIVGGLVAGEDHFIHFIPCSHDPVTGHRVEGARLVQGGDDVTDFVRKGMSTIHELAGKMTLLAAGTNPWDLIS